MTNNEHDVFKPSELFIENEEKYISFLLKSDALDCTDFHDKFFMNKDLRIIFSTIKDLVLENVKVEIDILYDGIKQKTKEISKEYLKIIIDKYSDFKNIDIVKKRIKENYLKQSSTKKILQNILLQTTNSGDLDITKVEEFQDELSETLLEIKDDNFNVLTFAQIIESKYNQLLADRNTGIRKRTLGFNWLDRYVTYPAEPGDITTIAMRKGEGKCVTKDTLLLTESGFKYIDSFSKNIKGMFYDCNEKILISDKTMQLPEMFYEEDVDETIKIKIKYGFEIEGTPEHPVLIFNKSGKHEYKKLQDIIIGDHVCISFNTNIFPEENKKIEFNYTRKKGSSNQKDITLPKIMTKKLARFLGYYTANGCIVGSRIALSTKNKKIQNDIKDILQDFNLDISELREKKDFNICSAEFISFINYLIGKKENEKFTARFKYVPKFILQSTKEMQIEFLKGLFDCDSWSNGNALEYCTASKRLCKEVQLMLLNLGLFAFQKKKYLKQYDYTYRSLTLSGNDFNNYKKMVDYKSTKYKFSSLNKKRNTNIKIIPYIKDYLNNTLYSLKGRLSVGITGYYKEDGISKKFPLQKANDITRTNAHDLTFNKAKDLYNLLNENSDVKHTNEVKESLNLLKTILDNNYLYFPVIDKKENSKLVTVYDFTIPKYHNFYSNGIISHNTVLGLNIANSMMNNKVPVVYFCFDMGYLTVMDRIICIRGALSNTELLEEEKDDRLIKKIEQELQRLMKINNFLVYPDGTISLKDLESYILKIKKIFRQNGTFKPDDKEEYFVAIFDTIDMMDDFSGADPYKIKHAINRLSTILKKHNIHAINLNQINESQIRAKRPKKIEDVDHIRFTKEDIEGGASFASRSRLVIMGTRVKAMKKSFFPEEEELLELEEDIMKLVIDKQNDGGTGMIKPNLIFDDQTYRLYEQG